MAQSLVSVIGQFLHPPIGLCSLELIAGGPYSGTHAFQRVRGPVNVDAFGIKWLITTAPDGYGLNLGPSVNYYDRAVLTVGVIHKIFDGSLNVSQQTDTRLVSGYLMFDQSFPEFVDVGLAPFVEAEFYWLLLL